MSDIKEALPSLKSLGSKYYGIVIRHLVTVLGFLLIALVAVFVFAFGKSPPYWSQILEYAGIAMGGVLVAIGTVIANRRAKAMEDAANAQADAVLKSERGQRQDRLKNGIEHLGNESTSVRLGGAYELFHLAEDDEDLRQTVLDILCSHLRHITGRPKYREKFKHQPSVEIQSCLKIVALQGRDVFKEHSINLQGCWLNGVDLERLCLRNAHMSGVHLRWAKLPECVLEGTDLSFAHLQCASLVKADLRNANLLFAHLEGAHITATMQGAVLHGASMCGASLAQSYLQCADLSDAKLQGANMESTHLEAAKLRNAKLQAAFLAGVRMHEADLKGCCLQGCTSHDEQPVTRFDEHVRVRIGETSNLSAVTFAGGLTLPEIDLISEGLSVEDAKKLKAKLKGHVGSAMCRELPEDSGAHMGAYSEEEAEQWIADYRSQTDTN